MTSGTCTECGQEIRTTARFCGACGADLPVPTEDEAAVARYRGVMARFVSEGGIDAREREQLEVLRERLGLSEHTRDRLMEELEASSPEPPTIRLFVDVSTIPHFEVGARCMMRFRVHNDGELALTELRFHNEVIGETPLGSVAVPTVFPGESETVEVWLTPSVGGYQELRGTIRATDLMGDERYYRFDPVQFRVANGSDAPQIRVVNIDQRSARVVDNSRSSFAGSEDDDRRGGLVAEGEWRSVRVRGISRPALASATATDAGARPAGVSGSPDFAVVTEDARFEVRKSVASGDLATVYRGVRVSDNLDVAVKVAYDADDNDLIRSEQRVLSMLHAQDTPQLKHLPKIVDRFRTASGQAGTVLQWCDGLDLLTIRERLPDGVPQHHLLWMLRRVLSVLGYAHSRGVIHGNVDPAHILVRPRDHNVWLLDWCYAIVDPARTKKGFVALNEDYSPPEVADRKPPVPASDLYSLGKCIIFAAGGDIQTLEMPASVDERIQRFLRFFVRESPIQRAQDAWDMYAQADNLREEVFGPHQFREFVV